MLCRPATPRVNAIFGSDASAEAALQEVLEKIGRDFLFGKAANIAASSDGRFEAAAAPHITEKLEDFLRVVEEQRANHLRRTPGLDSDAIFTTSHMQEVHKEWMNDYRSRMNAQTVQEYERRRNGRCKGDQQKARQLRRIRRWAKVNNSKIFESCKNAVDQVPPGALSICFKCAKSPLTIVRICVGQKVPQDLVHATLQPQS